MHNCQVLLPTSFVVSIRTRSGERVMRENLDCTSKSY